MKKVCCLIIASVLAFIVGYQSGRTHIDGECSTKTDTLIIKDTSMYNAPEVKDEKETEPIYITMPFKVVDSTAIFERDSLRHEVARLEYKNDSLFIALQRTQKHYSDSTFDAWVSGVNPRLDSLRVYTKSVIVTTTKYVDRNMKPRFSFGVQGGLGIVMPVGHYPTLGGYVGIGGAYNF